MIDKRTLLCISCVIIILYLQISGEIKMAEATDQVQSVNLDTDEAKALIAEQVKKQVEAETLGLASNRDDILAEKRELENKLKSVDIDKYNELIDRESKAEDDKLKEEGNVEVLFEKRFAKLEEDSRARADELNRRAEEAEQKASKATLNLENRVVGDVIRNAALKAGVTEAGALSDIVDKGLRTFKQENGEFVARDRNGDLLKNADDFIVTPDRFVEGLKASNPYYFPASVGVGALGSGSVGGGRQSLEEQAAHFAAEGDIESYKKIRTQMAKDK